MLKGFYGEAARLRAVAETAKPLRPKAAQTNLALKLLSRLLP